MNKDSYNVYTNEGTHPELSEDRFKSNRGTNDWGLYERLTRTHYGKGPKNYTRSPDRIREEACEILYHAWDIDASHIEVRMDGNVIILEGSVDSRETKRMVEERLEIIPGAEDVINLLKVNKRGLYEDAATVIGG